jgi:hypothetical protein
MGEKIRNKYVKSKKIIKKTIKYYAERYHF